LEMGRYDEANGARALANREELWTFLLPNRTEPSITVASDNAVGELTNCPPKRETQQEQDETSATDTRQQGYKGVKPTADGAISLNEKSDVGLSRTIVWTETLLRLFILVFDEPCAHSLVPFFDSLFCHETEAATTVVNEETLLAGLLVRGVHDEMAAQNYTTRSQEWSSWSHEAGHLCADRHWVDGVRSAKPEILRAPSWQAVKPNRPPADFIAGVGRL